MKDERWMAVDAYVLRAMALHAAGVHLPPWQVPHTRHLWYPASCHFAEARALSGLISAAEIVAASLLAIDRVHMILLL